MNFSAFGAKKPSVFPCFRVSVQSFNIFAILHNISFINYQLSTIN